MNQFISDIKEILRVARQSAYHTINTTMVKAYWLMGQRIVEEEQNGDAKAVYGTKLLKNLSKELSAEFGNGFSLANLKNFRKFYQTYPDLEKSYALRSFLSWTHHRIIMRIPDEKARRFYLEETSKQQWSTRELERQINTKHYERLLSTQTDLVSKESNASKYEIIKDPYVFEFLGLEQNHSVDERKLEDLLITDLQKFLLELGKGFSFVGRQFRISTETSHYYVDLVFYNYILKCFVLLDLKIEKLSHQDIGQMDMYIRMFDDLKKSADDNPTIGIILCTDKDETMIKYSVLDGHEQLFASKYLSYLPTEKELINEIEYVKQLNEKNHSNKE